MGDVIELAVHRSPSFSSFGNQGAAQAQNLRDAGIPNDKILVANRDDHYAKDAASKGFKVTHDFGEAAAVADVLFLLVPYATYPHALIVQGSRCHSVIRFSRVYSTKRPRLS